MLVVIDDVRVQPDGWKLFKSAEDFIYWRVNNSDCEIQCLSLDHDLGENVMDGYDLVKYLVNDLGCKGIKRVQLHTSNNVGYKNMYSYLTNALKHNVISKDTIISNENLDLIDGKFITRGYTFM